MKFFVKAGLGVCGILLLSYALVSFLFPHTEPTAPSLERILAEGSAQTHTAPLPVLPAVNSEDDTAPHIPGLPIRGGGRPVLAFTMQEGFGEPPSTPRAGAGRYAAASSGAYGASGMSGQFGGRLPQREEVIYKKIGEDGTIYLTNRPDGDSAYQEFARFQVADLIASLGMEGLMDLATRYGVLHGVDPHLIHAIIRAESGGNELAVSHAGAEGLMQLMPDTGRALGVSNAFNPDENVYGGTLYIKQMLDRYGDLSLALAAYNAGPGNVDKYGGIPPFTETQEYVKRVLRYYEQNKAGS